MIKKIVLLSTIKGIDTEEGVVQIPLSIMAIGTALEAGGYNLDIIDVQVDENWVDLLTDSLKDALFLGISSLTGPSIYNVLEAIKISREVNPNLPIVWGG